MSFKPVSTTGCRHKFLVASLSGSFAPIGRGLAALKIPRSVHLPRSYLRLSDIKLERATSFDPSPVLPETLGISLFFLRAKNHLLHQPNHTLLPTPHLLLKLSAKKVL